MNVLKISLQIAKLLSWTVFGMQLHRNTQLSLIINHYSYVFYRAL